MAALVLSACSGADRHDYYGVVGLPMPDVAERLGGPKRITRVSGEYLKNQLGPKPKLAQSLEDSETIEVWTYAGPSDEIIAVYFGEDGRAAEVILVPQFNY